MAINFKSHINLEGLQLRKAALHPLNTAPLNPAEGQVYWNTSDDKLYVSDGSNWIDVSGDVRQIDAGTGISVSGGSGGTATVSLSHLGIESLGAPESDAILFYDTSASGSKWLSPSSSSGIEISGTTLQLASIPNASLENSTFQVEGGNGLTGGSSATSLGSSDTLAVGEGLGISVGSDNVAIKGASSLSDDTIVMWDDTNGEFINSPIILDNSSNIVIGQTNDVHNLIVSGNLTVEGTTTTIDSNTVNIGDNILVLNADETGAASQDAGIEIERGTDDNKKFYWDETNNIWRTEGGLWIGTAAQQSSVTTQTKVLIQNTGTSQKVERIDIADIGTALGVGSHSILLDAVNRDNVAKSGNTFTVTHGLGSKLVQVQVVDATTYETVFVEVVRNADNTVQVIFADTVANGDYICMTTLVGALDTANIAS